MILAQIPQNGTAIQVEVLDAFEGAGGRKVARVRALAGQPFTGWTHGGWCQSDQAVVEAGLLASVNENPGR